MVIGLALDDGTGTVQLLGEYQAYHLMRESEPGEAQLVVGPLIYLWGKSIGTANDEYQAAGCLLALDKPLGQFDTA